MSKNEAITELKSLRKKREELSKQITESSKKLFKEASATLFDEFPVLQEFSWTAYTLYWNDGDECTFSSHHQYPSISFKGEDGAVEEDEEFTDGIISDWDTTKKKYITRKNLTPNQLAGKAVLDFLRNFDDDDIKNMFGDHVKIIVTSNGVEVEEHDHD